MLVPRVVALPFHISLPLRLLALHTSLGYGFPHITVNWMASPRTAFCVICAARRPPVGSRHLSPILLRPFGIPIRLGLTSEREWREDMQRLPPLTNVPVFGVFMVGAGMILAGMVMSLVDRRLFGQPWHFASLRDLVYGTILWAIPTTLVVFSEALDKTPD